MNTTRSKRSSRMATDAGDEDGDGEVGSVASILPPPRGGGSAGVGAARDDDDAMMASGASQPMSEGGGYGAQLAMLGASSGGVAGVGGSLHPSSRGSAGGSQQRARTPSILF